MRAFDADGLALCRMQGEIFERSLELTSCSSAVFVRRFMRSRVAERMDTGAFLLEATSVSAVFEELDGQYGETSYGKERYGAEELYWMGYVYRYWSYVHEASSSHVYGVIGARELRGLFFPYHSLDPEQAIRRILEAKNCFSEPKGVDEAVGILRRIRLEGKRASERED